MDDSKEYKPLRQSVDIKYPLLMEQQKVWLEKHWVDFNSEKAKLENIVGKEFGKVIEEIGIQVPHWILLRNPSAETPKILDYKTEYNPQSKEFRIRITRFRLSNGKIMDDSDVLSSQYGCPHVVLESICGFSDEIHPRIKSFKEEYSVRDINYPINDCNHK